VLLALLGGACFEAGRPFYPADIADALSQVPEPRALVTTPFHLKTLVLAGLPLPRVALTLSATAPLSPQLAAQAEAAFEGPLVEIYGCTEAGQVASRRTTTGETWTALGELQITADTSGDEERFTVLGGHVLEPTLLADVLVLQDSRRFKLLGRANDLIHVAGKRSSLAHLNFHLNRIEGVDDGAFWLPDDVAEGIVRTMAFVVAPRLSAREVVAALREHLEPAFVPRRVIHVEQLPREATGKLTAAALRKLALSMLEKLDSKASPGTLQARAAETPASPPAPGQQHSVLDIATDHPTFAGHFPGQPVLPGVSLLSLVLQALADQPLLAAKVSATPRIDNAKFLSPVGPGARLLVHFKEAGSGVGFEVKQGDTVVARGQLSAPSA
jgi:acyl-coenzyme A synthetase/AMP-(fatty) acid ligase/3-hydroxymyristoyl/3-hydroxydecanoyl-(acyl carrier protein) dehydratase